DRDAEVLQARLDLETARRGEVLEVDAAEYRRDQPYRADDLVDVLGRQADRKRIDVGELLEQHRLAFHHRDRRFGPQVADAEDRRSIGDDGDGVVLERELVHL